MLVSYFPDLVGDLLGEGESVEMFKGVEEYMPGEESVDEISKSSIPSALTPPPHVLPLFAPCYCFSVVMFSMSPSLDSPTGTLFSSLSSLFLFLFHPPTAH